MEDTKYNFSLTPEWAEAISDADLIEICVESDQEKRALEEGKTLQFLLTEVVNTSNNSNQHYSLQVIKLSNSDTLQAISVSEISLLKNESIHFHRFGVVRKGIFLDKKDETRFRVIDNEANSSRGVIDEKKSLHWIVRDVHIDDIFVLEYTKINTFTHEDILDSLFFFHIENLTAPFIYTKKYSFRLLQNRAEKIRIKEMYFKDSSRSADIITLSEGQEYNFVRNNFKNELQENTSNPFIQIATDSSWKEISTTIYALYEHILKDTYLQTADISEVLGLNDKNKPLSEKIYSILEYVQKDIIYLFDADVMHGHIPDVPEKILSDKAADCKGKSVLLSNLLSFIGVENEVILVNYSFDSTIGIFLPTPFIFNHMIVKIKHGGKNYFIDPTWNRSDGTLEHRSQAILTNFLPITRESDLVHRKTTALNIPYTEESTQITLRNGILFVETESVLRMNLADQLRYQLRSSGNKETIKYRNSILASRMELPPEDTDKLFFDGFFSIIRDDVKNNELIISYKTKVKYDGKKNLKYYYGTIDPRYILKYSNKDVLCNSCVSYPFEFKLNVRTDIPIITNDEVTKRNTTIDNAYFSFSNIKKISTKEASIHTKFIPKTYDPILEKDLPEVKEDYKKILNSNMGGGFAFKQSQFFNLNLRRNRWALIWLSFLLIRLLISISGN